MSTRPDPLDPSTVSAETPAVRILLAEDDAEMRSLLRLALEEAGYEVRALSNGGELLDELERNHRETRETPYRTIVSDVRMPGPTGLEILEALRAYEWLPPVILITAFGDPRLHETARSLGAVAVLDKPFETDALVTLIKTCVGRRRACAMRRPGRTDGEPSSVKLSVRGAELMNDPLLNKGTCFTQDEREQFGLEGLLPPGVSTLKEQRERVWGNYALVPDDVQRYMFLAALQDRNETLFYRLLLDHIEELAPIVYTPTVGAVCAAYSRLYRRPRGIYVSAAQRGRIESALRRAPVDDCRIIVLTDNEAILGLGDLGVGGMRIPVGKLTLYTAGAGIHPSSCLPIDLDVGTQNTSLLEDPLYLGLRQPRLTGEDYFSLLDELVDGIRRVFPRALVQWEDFANENAFQVQRRYRTRVPSFDDDIQGTGAVVVAGLRTALHRAGRPLAGERVVFYGAGASGGGCALAVRAAMRAAGVSPGEVRRRVLCLDSRGLILDDRAGLDGHKQLLAADAAVVADWAGGEQGSFGLDDVVQNFQPTILVGASGQPGAFTEQLVRTMRARCPRPVIFPLSNPTSQAEAAPADLLRWTEGAGLVASGSPTPSVRRAGEVFEIGQVNNVLIFPGLGLGAIAVGASEIPDAVFLAAADALFEISRTNSAPGAPLFPPIRDLRRVSRAVASAVAHSLVEVEAAPPYDSEEIERRISSLVWKPAYRPYVFAGASDQAT